MLRLRTLGRLRLENVEGVKLVAGLRKDLLLLAWLARLAPRAASRTELAGLLWSDRPEPKARHSLRQVLANLRSVLGPALDAGADSVSIVPGSVLVDVDELLEALSAGRLIETIDWQADFLAGAEGSGGEVFRSWLDAERESIRRQVALQFERLGREAASQNRHDEAVTWAERWASLAPFDERAAAARLDSLCSAGRFSEALAHHRLFVLRLHRELGALASQDFMSRRSDIEGVLRTAPPPASHGSAALFTPDLVGRDGVLAELFAAWRQVRHGESAVVLVEGEVGEGKTRLCTEFLRALEHDAMAPFVLRGRGRDDTAETSRPSATHAWTTARALLSTLRSAPGLSGAAASDLADLSVLAPMLRRRFPQLPPAHGNERGLPATMVRVLEAVAWEVPVVVFIDDFTSADRETQDLLSGFAMRISARVLLILAIESEERTSTASLATVHRIPRVRRLRMRPLDAAEVESLIASMIACQDGIRTALADRLHAETRGNPLFVAEIIASLVDEGRLAPDANGMWRLTDDRSALPLPATVRDAIRRLVARLSEPAAHTLAAASTLSEPWEMTALEAVSDISPDRLASAVEELVGRRFICPDPDRTGPVRFRLGHPVLRRALAEGIGRARGEAVSPGSSPHRSGWRLRVSRALESRNRRWMRRAGMAAVAMAALGSPILLATRQRLRDTSGPPLIAIGLIRDFAGADSTSVAKALPEMLATNLARVPQLRVVSQARLYEINAQLGETSLTTAGVARAARIAGARELIEGELYAASPGQLRLDLRRISMNTGAVQSTQRLQGHDVFNLVDDATSRIAAEFGTTAELHLADITTQSVIAYRFYEEGLRGYYQGDMNRALALFHAALREDSTFALAAYYGVLAEQGMSMAPDSALQARLFRTVDRLPDRTRLFMRANLAMQSMDPYALVMADTLTTRYPSDPEAHLLHGQILAMAGDYIPALAYFHQVIGMDSLGFRANSPLCRACDAFGSLIGILALIDSIPAAERTTRDWIRLQPAAAQPWNWLASILADEGRFAEAQAAKERAASYEPGHPYDHVFPGILAVMEGNFSAADDILSEQVRSAPEPVRKESIWFLVISLRYQGRFAEALEQAHDYARRYPEEPGDLPEGQVLYEMGRYREAATHFRRAADRIMPDRLRRAPGALARQRSWYLTQAANAIAAAGDTASLRALADTIEVLGSGSLWDRDRRLHRYVRGLLLAARGDHAKAAESFLAATKWPLAITSEYNRTNFELARELLVLGRASEAVRPLELALAGPIEASNYYMSRSDLHALLGRAFESTGQLDSAVVHYRWTVGAWQDADSVLHARRDSLRTRLEAIEAARRIARSGPWQAAEKHPGVRMAYGAGLRMGRRM